MSIVRNNNSKPCDIYCDVCGREINYNALHWELEIYNLNLDDETCDNYEDFDFCSEKCVREKFEEYIEKSKEYKDKPLCFNLNNALIKEGF